MDFQKINNAFSNNDFGNLSEIEINELIHEFPYCGNFKAIVSKLHQSSSDHKIKKSIKEAAPQINNRSAFYHFLFKETLKSTFNKIENEIIKVEDQEKSASKKEDIPPSGNKTDLNKVEIISETEVEKTNSDSVKASLENEDETKVENQNEISNKNNIDKNVQKATSTEVNKPLKQEKPESKNQELMLKELEKQIVSSAVSSTIMKETDEPFIDDADNVEEKDAIDYSGKKTFSGWLKNIKENKSDLKSQKEKRLLIERFIQTDPQITPKQTAFFSVAEKAKLSLAEDEAFVTETLAEIYAKQGNTSKAIKAYEILMLKIPQKKTLFAARIKELKSTGKK